MREPAKFFGAIILMMILPYLMIATQIILSNPNEDRIELAFVFLFAAVVMVVFISIEFLFLYLIMYRRFKKIYVILNEEAIVYNNAKGEIRIPYENIKKLEFPSIKYAGGWMKIVHKGGNIRLTVVLHNIGDMVQCLKDKLDEKGMSNVYKDKAIYNFIKTAKYSDQSWDRIYEGLKRFAVIVAINIGVAAIFSAFIADITVKIIVFIAALVGPLLTYLFSEIFFLRKLSKGVSKENFSVPDRDKPYELKIYKWAFGIYTVLFLLVLLLLIV